MGWGQYTYDPRSEREKKMQAHMWWVAQLAENALKKLDLEEERLDNLLAKQEEIEAGFRAVLRTFS